MPMLVEHEDPIEEEEDGDAGSGSDDAVPGIDSEDGGSGSGADDGEGVSGEVDEGASEEGDAAKEDEGGDGSKEDDPKPRAFSLKVDGEVIEKNEEETIALAQKGLHADRTLFEAKELAAMAENLQSAIIQDPMEVTRQLLLGQGYSDEQVDDAVYKYLETQFAANFKRRTNPDEGKRYKFERERANIERARAELADERKRMDEEKHTRDVAVAKSSFEKEVTGAIKDAGLPESDDTVLAIAEKVRDAEESGEELSTLDAARIVKKEFAARKKTRIPGLSLAELKEEYPEEYAKLMREHKETLKQRSTTPGKAPVGKTATNPARRDKAGRRYTTWSDLGIKTGI